MKRPGTLALVWFLGAVVSAQTPTPAPQQTPVFRGGTTVVPLTVTVLDKNGAPVTDLKQSDFTVVENGQLREIVNFFPQPFEPRAASSSTDAPANRAPGSAVTPQTSRTFLIVLGYGRIQYPTRAVDGAIEFVRSRLLPQDAVAVMGFHRTTDLTTDHEQIAQILERYKKEHEKLVLEINEFRVMSRSPYGTPGGPPIPDKFLKRIDAIFTGATPADGGGPPPIAIRSTTSLLFGMDRAVPVIAKPGQQQETLAELQQNVRDSGDEMTDAVLLGTRNKFYAGIEFLRYLRGEKHMLVLADIITRSDDDAKVLAQRATDARVVVDLVATNGTNRFGGGGGSPSSRWLADLTGGYYTSLEVASKAVTKIDQATRFSYLLGYTPSNPTLDGRYRDVEVKVNRPGVTVRFSHGYFAAAQPEPLALKDLLVKSRLEAALAYDSEAKDIKLNVALTMLPRMGVQAQARLEVTIDASQLAFTMKDGLHVGQLELQAYCGDAKQNVIGEFGERLDLEADDATHAGFLQAGIRRVLRVPVMDAAPKYVKVVVYDYGSDRAGSYVLTIK